MKVLSKEKQAEKEKKIEEDKVRKQQLIQDVLETKDNASKEK